jgi:integrase
MKLTDKLVDDIEPPTNGIFRMPDSELKGFNAQVTPSGARAFVLRYRIRGRQRLYTIGSRSAWSTVAARNRARELRRLIDQGIDPHEMDARQRDDAITVADFWERIYEPLHVRQLRPKTANDMRSMMKNDILPRLGDRPVKDVDHADAAALHRTVTKRAPMRANRVRNTLSGIMSWAERPHIDSNGDRVPTMRPPFSNPCRGVKKNLEEPREVFLSPAKIARLAEVLERRPERTIVALVRFLLLTGARFSEAANATWSQFDFERGTWTKPSSHVKQKKSHTVPLSAPALLLLQQLREQNGPGEFLFPSSVTGRPLTQMNTKFWKSVCRQAGLENVRIHDLRHTFASTLASGGASLPLIGQLLGHTQAQTTARYSHLVDAVQREAVERAGAVIAGQPTAEVVEIRKAK